MEKILFEVEFQASLHKVRDTRSDLSRAISACHLEKGMLRNMLVCFSEAATNLVMYNHQTPLLIILRFGCNIDFYWIELWDNGTVWDPTNYKPSEYCLESLEQESGRGITLVNLMSDNICYYPEDIYNKTSTYNRLLICWNTPYKQYRSTVLIVEDDLSTARLYAAYLTDTFNIELVNNGEEAIEYLTRNRVDLVISDIQMPRMDGLSLREVLSTHEETESVPFIFLSGKSNHDILEKACLLGIDDFLLKPVSKLQLNNAVIRVNNRSKQLYRQLSRRLNSKISSLLAPKLPSTTNDWNMAVTSRNTGIGGGDLLLYEKNDSGIILAIVDIMGHDDKAKFFAYAYGGYIRGIMQSTSNTLSPSKLLANISQIALSDGLLSQVTLTCCVIALKHNGTISIASAAHPMPLLLSKGKAAKIQVGGILPGLIPHARYDTVDFSLNEGERIAFYTDGLFESASDNQSRHQLEYEIIEKLVSTTKKPLNNALDETISTFDRLTGSSVNDDSLLLLIEHQPKSA
ncbi:MAG: hypothetical protein COA99_15555 [Moraxellaceae bacterium]|nr:MAG: hypothetical protein COA99_15555 [Moraxellaceae bacterium]